ncbi:hypothetical protein RJ640_023984 [Escallonia rubra]|uniref:Mono-/di-acylglycerol lipase N-terminal domain-containing protein n=1 Tax=Escallonia rubra TaxID=112253 RepID=A0AA88U0E0_9ASTE|nr:hypothetical protein RJ640_023984 [Escallonia rubra]
MQEQMGLMAALISHITIHHRRQHLLTHLRRHPSDHAGITYCPCVSTHHADRPRWPLPRNENHPPKTHTASNTHCPCQSTIPITTGHHLPTKINYDHHNHTGERWMLLLLRAFHTVGSDDSATWASATVDEFAPVPRVCRLILAVYEEDLRNPQFPPAHGGYRLNPDWVVKRVTYEQTGPPATRRPT